MCVCHDSSPDSDAHTTTPSLIASSAVHTRCDVDGKTIVAKQNSRSEGDAQAIEPMKSDAGDDATVPDVDGGDGGDAQHDVVANQ